MKIFAHFCLSATSVCGTRILSFINTCIAIDCRMRVDKRRGGGCRLTGSLVTVNDFRVEGVVGSSLLCPSGRISVSQNDGASSLTHPPLAFHPCRSTHTPSHCTSGAINLPANTPQLTDPPTRASECLVSISVMRSNNKLDEDWKSFNYL